MAHTHVWWTQASRRAVRLPLLSLGFALSFVACSSSDEASHATAGPQDAGYSGEASEEARANEADGISASLPDAKTPEEASADAGAAAQDSGMAPAQASIPCPIETILKASCRGCHGSPPSGGAPFALVTYADMIADRSGEPTYKVMLREVEAKAMPPKADRISEADRATLVEWLRQGAPPSVSGQLCP